MSVKSEPTEHVDTRVLSRKQTSTTKHVSRTINRLQTEIHFKKRLLKVLRGLDEQADMTLADLLEGMALHCFEDTQPFSHQTVQKIKLHRTATLGSKKVTISLPEQLSGSSANH